MWLSLTKLPPFSTSNNMTPVEGVMEREWQSLSRSASQRPTKSALSRASYGNEPVDYIFFVLANDLLKCDLHVLKELRATETQGSAACQCACSTRGSLQDRPSASSMHLRKPLHLPSAINNTRLLRQVKESFNAFHAAQDIDRVICRICKAHHSP